jgi:hypothetical protein
MAILLADFVWEGTSVERPGVVGARDGHIYKELDTGESYVRVSGEWKNINLGLSFIKATKSGLVTTNASGVYAVVFTTPFISDEYTVAFGIRDAGSSMVVAAYFSDITPGGFSIQTRNVRTGLPVGDVVVSWLATRNYNP